MAERTKVNLENLDGTKILVPNVNVDEISDIAIDSLSLADGDILKYDSNTNKWINDEPETSSIIFRTWED